MTLEQFAKAAGVSLVECDGNWGGHIGWRAVDHPNSTYCGYKTEQAAYKSWLESSFGKQTAKAVIKLLQKTERKK